MTDRSRRYTVIGPGAVGLLYGARLQASGHEVCWVTRSGAESIARGGVHVSSPEGSVDLAGADVTVVDDPGDAPPGDVVLVALKTTANRRLDSLVGPAVRPGATVAVFQNGLGVEAQMRAAVPHAGPIVGAMCFVCAHRRRHGVCDHLDYGAVTVGHLDDHDEAPRASVALVDDLVASGTDATVVPDLGVARWRKLVWNIPFNGLSVVLDASTDELLADRAARSLVVALMDEVIAAATSTGAVVEPSFRDEMLATTDAMTPYAPSMKLDHDAGRPMEIGAIYDAPIAAAETGGTTMAKVAVLRDQLHFLDRLGRSGTHG